MVKKSDKNILYVAINTKSVERSTSEESNIENREIFYHLDADKLIFSRYGGAYTNGIFFNKD